eukprot:728091-Amphidinium_carterae.1
MLRAGMVFVDYMESIETVRSHLVMLWAKRTPQIEVYALGKKGVSQALQAVAQLQGPANKAYSPVFSVHALTLAELDTAGVVEGRLGRYVKERAEADSHRRG